VKNNIHPLKYLYQKSSAENKGYRKGFENPENPYRPEIKFHEGICQESSYLFRRKLGYGTGIYIITFSERLRGLLPDIF
jgi:hypothetical protein